jgi:putative heme iron utilization protein
MSEIITPAISDRICQHMNEDHSDAVALYARVYGNAPQADSAVMKSIDPQGMNLSAKIGNDILPVRVEFDHTLQDAEDAHHTLIDLLKQARQS